MITKEIAWAKSQAALAEHQLDALVAVSPWNVVYTAGTVFLTQRTIPDRLALSVQVPGQDPVLIYCTIEDQQARDEAWTPNLRGYTEFADNPIDVLAAVLRELGADQGRIGIEKRFLVAAFHERLEQALPGARLIAADSIFDRMRAVKTSEEIAFLGQVAYWTDEAIRTAFEQARIGDTELAMGERMMLEARKHGASSLLHLVLAFGENGAVAHHEPTETALRPGDVVRTDFGMFWGNYVSDIARTAIAAPATPARIDVYKRLEDIHQTVIAAMKPGVPCSNLYALCAETYESHGLPFPMPHIGHTIGLGVHDNPMMHPFDHTPLEPGMVLMLEPLVITSEGVFHTEDMIEITETGNCILSRSADWSDPLIVGDMD